MLPHNGLEEQIMLRKMEVLHLGPVSLIYPNYVCSFLVYCDEKTAKSSLFSLLFIING